MPSDAEPPRPAAAAPPTPADGPASGSGGGAAAGTPTRSARRRVTRPSGRGLVALAVGNVALVALAITALATPLPTSPEMGVPKAADVWQSPIPRTQPVSVSDAEALTADAGAALAGLPTWQQPARPGAADARGTMAFTGDVLIHPRLTKAAAEAGARSGASGGDFGSMLAPLAPYVSNADVAVCHLETVLTRDPAKASGHPVIRTTDGIARAIKDTGYDTCSTTSNHALDFGRSGALETLSIMDEAGVHSVGTAPSQERAEALTMYDVNGIKVGHAAFAYGFNNNKVPADSPWLANRIDPGAVAEAARRLRLAGAELVVLSLHWGQEDVTAPTEQQTGLATALAHTGLVDLIVGHHAHVPQPVTRIGDMWVAYGLGNSISGQNPSPGREAVMDGVLLQAEFERKAGRAHVHGLTVVPTAVEQGPWQVMPVADALAGKVATGRSRQWLEASWERTAAAVTSLGAVEGVTVAR